MRQAHTPLMSIALEGWLVLAVLAVASTVAWLNAAFQTSIVLALLVIPAALFFADTARKVPSRPRGVLAPVDGTVIHRRECHDPIVLREAIRVTLAVDFWGGYCLRAPLEGEVLAPPPGTDRASMSRIQTDEGDDVLIVLARGWMFGARPVRLPYGARVGQGRRCGLRRLARQIDIYLPANARVEVQLGQRVRCGETTLATLLRKP